VKPDALDDRNTQIIEKIEENLAGTGAEKTELYKFDDMFAALHPQDAAAIVAFNLEQVAGQQVDAPAQPAADASPAELAAHASALTASASKKLADAVNVDTLVAHDYDNAFPTLIRKLLPLGLGIKGFVLAAIFGAVVSSLASMLNSASTIAAMDIYRKVRKDASQYELVTVGRICVVLFVLIAMIIAPFLGRPEFGGIFTFIQEFQGFISPGILSIFLFGLLVHRAPRYVGTVGLVLNPILYGLFKFSPALLGDANPALLAKVAEWSFLNRMALCFGLIIAVLSVLTAVHPLKQPVDLPVNKNMNLDSSPGAKLFGLGVVIATIALYIIFW
jgi:SSS family solute:Na+ symporter